MNKPLHIIYVPGLGEGDYRGQRKAVEFWRHWGVEAELFSSNWGDKKPWSSKRALLLARVDELASESKQIGLVGVSAGASAALNVYAARKNVIVGVVCIAGWINRPEAIHPRHLEINPAFITSVKDCQMALESLNDEERHRILSRYGVIDKIVNKTNSRLKGAHNQMVPGIGHGFTIATQIIFGAPSFIRFLKS